MQGAMQLSSRLARSSLGMHRCFLGATIQSQARSSSRLLATLRRKRRFGPKIEDHSPKNVGRMESPYAHGEQNMEAYLKKATLSPWVPLPDSAARKIFDLAQASPEDIHVDLGSGDGRVNFYAIDFGIKRSTGIDIDEKIVALANERLAKRHPKPNLEFLVADLLDESNPVWALVHEATLITMYFADEALTSFRPVLEKKLAGKKCKIITCGYEMPGWDYSIQEVVLGMKLSLYEWGSEEAFHDVVLGDNILGNKLADMERDIYSNSQFSNANLIDRIPSHPVRGFNPEIVDEIDEDEWADDEDNEKKE